MADQPPPTPKARSRARLALQVVGSLVLVVAIFYYLFQGIDLAQVWADIRAMTWLEDLTLLAAAVWNMATYSLVWMTVAPGLGFWRATMMSQSTAAVSSTVPWAGPVIGTGMTYSMFGQWGYSGAQTTTEVLVSGVWNSFAKLALPVLALALLALQGGVAGGRVVAGLVGIAGLVGAIVVFALILRSEDLARRFGLWASRVASRLLGLVRRPPVQGWEVATVRFRARTLALLGGRWGPITAATLVSHLSTYLVLLVALRHVGISDAEVSWVQVLAWFAFARLLTAVPVTPAGLGLVEATLIGGLTGAGGDREQVTAAVLVYRALTWFLPILVGAVCLLWWRRSRLASQPATAGGPPLVAPGSEGAPSTDRPGFQARDRQSRP